MTPEKQDKTLEKQKKKYLLKVAKEKKKKLLKAAKRAKLHKQRSCTRTEALVSDTSAGIHG